MAVPSDPQNTDESFKFPNVAQDLLSQCSLLTQVLTEGGRAIPVVEDNEEEDEEEAEDDSVQNDKEEDGNLTDEGNDHK